jgi:hypothetical protein
MHLLIPNRGEGGNHHVEAVKPAPVLDEVKTGSSRRSQRQQSERDDFQQAKALQV